MFDKLIQVPGFNLGFTTVEAGNLAVHMDKSPQVVEQAQRNRVQLEEYTGVAPNHFAFLHQIHSNAVARDPQGWGDTNQPVQADASISTDGTQPLGILVADCLPIVFIATYTTQKLESIRATPEGAQQQATAVAHAGRVGLLNGVIENTIRELRGLAQHHVSIQAWIGPSICGHCYEVPEQMQTEAIAQLPELKSTTSWGTHALDLAAGAQKIMEDHGVTVHRSPNCTLENPRYYSHRRQPGQGRIAGLVWPTETSDTP